MKLSPAQLAKHLQGNLAPVYVISGDEPLLCQEACDAIRAACRQRDFSERQVFNAEANFDWGLLLAGATAATIPVVILFAFVGRWFVSGLTEGAVK